MITLYLQWDRHSGPSEIGQHKLTFSMDESVNSGDFNPLHIKKGTQFIVMMIEADTKEAQEFRDESPEESKERFRKRMNSLINQVAEANGFKGPEFRDLFKTELKERGLIKESTKELNLEGYAKVIGILNEKLYARQKPTRTK